MICILSNTDDPYFNLAAEEYLLKNPDEEVFMLWQCDSAIVTGKHQNALAEINYPYVRKNGIKVARRLSGGGTVFHDKGNVNFTFIRNGEKGKLVDYERHMIPVINILKKMGINVQPGNKNEIFLEGKKISGNAEHIYKERILHHGTLLFDSDIDRLNRAIKVIPGKYHDKAVRSNRSNVTNIMQHLDEKITVEEFRIRLFHDVMNLNPDARLYHFSSTDLLNVNHLVRQKYSTWEWIYGYSPAYRFENRIALEGKVINIKLDVGNGIIRSAAVSGDLLTASQAKLLAGTLVRQKHNESQIRRIIDSCFRNQLYNDMMGKMVEAFF
ncbi:MAG: lipoate--protein ligase [Bacteroidales bacterium]|nr:lipoate--protein ligase [Bacteroidales bacterium]